MLLQSVDKVDEISPEDFKNNYYLPKKPLIITGLAKQWPAYNKWNWDYLQDVVGGVKVGLYNNVKSDAYTPINKADDYKTFGEYIAMIKDGPAAWRIFLFNIFEHAPQITKDFTWPEHLMKGFVKRYPMLFTGGKTSITHMHFDIDLSHILHTQFLGRKRVLLFPHEEQHKLYRKPFEVLSLADFSNYYKSNGTPDYAGFPALKFARGYDVILEHGDTLFMPAGYWHHMEYLDSGFAMSLRALQNTTSGKLKGVWNLFGMRTL
ncbi:MAG: cupin-like domain-containing protein, partial [Ginsengibacter sp.]